MCAHQAIVRSFKATLTGMNFNHFMVYNIALDCSLSIGVVVSAAVPTVGYEVGKCNVALHETNVHQVQLSQDLDPPSHWLMVNLPKVLAFFHIDTAHCFH